MEARRMNDQPKRERIRIAAAAGIVGVSISKLRSMVAYGKVPGAAFIDDRVLTFDEARLRAWIKDRETELQKRASITPSVAYRPPSLALAPPRYGDGKSSGRFDKALRILRDHERKESAKRR
jgi:hypothetical protein